MCTDIKLKKLKSTCSADTEAHAQIESSESGPLSLKSLLLKISIEYEDGVVEVFKLISMFLKPTWDLSMD